jgi:hypothetical protein
MLLNLGRFCEVSNFLYKRFEFSVDLEWNFCIASKFCMELV